MQLKSEEAPTWMNPRYHSDSARTICVFRPLGIFRLEGAPLRARSSLHGMFEVEKIYPIVEAVRLPAAWEGR